MSDSFAVPLDVEGGLDLDGRSILTFAPIEVWSMLGPPSLKPPSAWSSMSGKTPHFNVHGKESKSWPPPKSKAAPPAKPAGKGGKGKIEKGDKGKCKSRHDSGGKPGNSSAAKGEGSSSFHKGSNGKGIYVPASSARPASHDDGKRPKTKAQKKGIRLS